MVSGKQHMLLRPRQILAPVIFATVFGYFGYHLVNGDRGLLAMVHLQRENQIADQNLAEAEATRKIWELRVSELRNQSLDPDMLDERSRILLNYARKDDVIIFTPTR
jgi:cell division protein FtsB